MSSDAGGAIPHLGLQPTPDPNRFTWSPSPLLLTPASMLQGGAGLGVAIAAMSAVTGRPAIWAAAQYLTYAAGTDHIDIRVTVEVAGHNTTQARCVLARDDREILTVHAALGRRDLRLESVWCSPPEVPAPGECERYAYFKRGRGDIGDLAELRLARGRQLEVIETAGGRGDGNFALWVRSWDGRRLPAPADLAFIGDFMPIGFADAIGHRYAGNSLDNTIRIGELVETEWVLLSIHIQQVTNGFGYGRAELWTEDGHLLAEVSQSAVLREYTRMGGTGRAP